MAIKGPVTRVAPGNPAVAASASTHRIKHVSGIVAPVAASVLAVLGTGGSGAAFPLPAGHFVSTAITGMLPTIVFPRPDLERGAGSRCNYAHPDMPFSFPVCAQGGSWPHRIEITGTSGPADMSSASIGETLVVAGDSQQRPDSYAVFTFTPNPADNGLAFGVSFRLTDNDGNTATVTVNGTIDRDRFAFFDPGATGSSNLGTIAHPFTSWEAGFGTDSGVALQGMIAVFRGGNHVLQGYAGNQGNYRLEGTNKPLAYIAYPGESPRIDLSSGFFSLQDVNDFYVDGIEFHDNDQSDAVGRMFGVFGSGDRFVMWRTTLTNFSQGTNPGTSNPAAVYMSDVPRQYGVFLSNTLDGEQATFLQLYKPRDYVIEDTSFGPTAVYNQSLANSNWGIIYFKDGPQRCSVRANNLVGATFNVNVNSLIAVGAQAGYEDLEFCWNKADAGINDFSVVAREPTAFATDRVYQFRNSIMSGRIRTFNSPPDTTHYIGKNISQDSLSIVAPNTQDDNLFDHAGVFDANGNLQGPARAAHLGLRGAEVA